MKSYYIKRPDATVMIFNEDHDNFDDIIIFLRFMTILKNFKNLKKYNDDFYEKCRKMTIASFLMTLFDVNLALHCTYKHDLYHL